MRFFMAMVSWEGGDPDEISKSPVSKPAKKTKDVPQGVVSNGVNPNISAQFLQFCTVLWNKKKSMSFPNEEIPRRKGTRFKM